MILTSGKVSGKSFCFLFDVIVQTPPLVKYKQVFVARPTCPDKKCTPVIASCNFEGDHFTFRRNKMKGGGRKVHSLEIAVAAQHGKFSCGI